VNYDCFVKGTSEYTFDVSEGYFKTANIEIRMVAKSIVNDDEVDSRVYEHNIRVK